MYVYIECINNYIYIEVWSVTMDGRPISYSWHATILGYAHDHLLVYHYAG